MLWSTFTKTISNYRAQRLHSVDAREAAVLILVRQNPRAEILLTKRALHLKHHAGQISFPGGAKEQGDLSTAHTALREFSEECGSATDHISILGTLDETHVSVSGFKVTPVVATNTAPLLLTPNLDEVESLLWLPLQKVLDASQWRSKDVVFHGRPITMWQLSEQGHVVWGATALMLRGLRKVLT